MVLNPAAGGGRTARQWPSLRARLRRAGLEFEAAETTGPGAATALAREAVSAGWPLVVAVGGDGTVNEVVNGLVDPQGRALAALGAIVTGRGRDVCRNLAIARDPDIAADRLVHGDEVTVDVGAAASPRGGLRYFVNSLGAGFDAVAAARARATGRSGTVPYLLGVAAALREHRPVSASIALDGRPAWTGSLTAMIAANGAYYGGGMKIAPPARPDDGELDVVIVGGLGRARLLAWLPAVYVGAHLRNPGVTTARATAIDIDTDPAVLVHVDGEPLGRTPARITIRAGALRLRR